MVDISTERMADILVRSWSPRTSGKYNPDNPAYGQCDVTALVVQDFLGGDLVKCWYFDVWHYYNMIEGRRHDFTVTQFESLPEYEDLPATREEAMKSATERQYQDLRNAVTTALNQENI